MNIIYLYLNLSANNYLFYKVKVKTMKCDVFTTEKMKTACWRMVQDIERLDYIAAHRMETDKAYQDILKMLEEDLCAIESSVGEMRSDLSSEDKDARYRELLVEKNDQEEMRIFLAGKFSLIQSELKGISNSIELIPKRFLEYDSK